MTWLEKIGTNKPVDRMWVEIICIKLQRIRKILSLWERQYLNEEKFWKTFVFQELEKLESKQEVQQLSSLEWSTYSVFLPYRG